MQLFAMKNWPIWERLLEYWIIISWNNQCQNMFCSLLVVYMCIVSIMPRTLTFDTDIKEKFT